MHSAPHSLWKKSEDAWRTLAEEPAIARPRPRSGTRPPSLVSSAPLALVEQVRARRPAPSPPPPPVDELLAPIGLGRSPRGWRLQTPTAGLPIPIARAESPLDSWSRSEQRLWRVAGSLMALALVVVGVLGVLTFWPLSALPARAAPVTPVESGPRAGKAPVESGLRAGKTPVESGPRAGKALVESGLSAAAVAPVAKIKSAYRQPARRHTRAKRHRR